MTRPSSEVQADLDAAIKTLKDIRKRLADLEAERSKLSSDERRYLDSWSEAGIISKLKHELTRSKAVELSYAVNAIPVVFTRDHESCVVAKVTAKQIYCCARDGSSGFKTDLTGKIHTKTHSAQFIDMQATFGKDLVRHEKMTFDAPDVDYSMVLVYVAYARQLLQPMTSPRTRQLLPLRTLSMILMRIFCDAQHCDVDSKSVE